MKITCVIPTIGRLDYLSQAVNSILAQRAPSIDEIIIVNNGAGKITMDFCDDRVKIYDLMPFSGVSQARNFGAALSSNNILTFLDDDDFWPEFYLNEFSKHWSDDIDFCLTRLDKYYDGIISPYKKILRRDLCFNVLFIKNPGITGSNIFVKKSVFFQVGGFDPRLKTSEDKDFLIKLIDGKFKSRIINDLAVCHRVHDNDRLSNADSLLLGMGDFYRKYRSRFNIRMKLVYFKKMVKIRLKKRTGYHNNV